MMSFVWVTHAHLTISPDAEGSTNMPSHSKLNWKHVLGTYLMEDTQLMTGDSLEAPARPKASTRVKATGFPGLDGARNLWASSAAGVPTPESDEDSSESEEPKPQAARQARSASRK